MSAVSAAHPAPRASVALGGGGEKQAASEQSPRRVPKCQGLFPADSFQIKKRPQSDSGLEIFEEDDIYIDY